MPGVDFGGGGGEVTVPISISGLLMGEPTGKKTDFLPGRVHDVEHGLQIMEPPEHLELSATKVMAGMGVDAMLRNRQIVRIRNDEDEIVVCQSLGDLAAHLNIAEEEAGKIVAMFFQYESLLPQAINQSILGMANGGARDWPPYRLAIASEDFYCVVDSKGLVIKVKVFYESVTQVSKVTQACEEEKKRDFGTLVFSYKKTDKGDALEKVKGYELEKVAADSLHLLGVLCGRYDQKTLSRAQALRKPWESLLDAVNACWAGRTGVRICHHSVFSSAECPKTIKWMRARLQKLHLSRLVDCIEVDIRKLMAEKLDGDRESGEILQDLAKSMVTLKSQLEEGQRTLIELIGVLCNKILQPKLLRRKKEYYSLIKKCLEMLELPDETGCLLGIVKDYCGNWVGSSPGSSDLSKIFGNAYKELRTSYLRPQQIAFLNCVALTLYSEPEEDVRKRKAKHALLLALIDINESGETNSKLRELVESTLYKNFSIKAGRLSSDSFCLAADEKGKIKRINWKIPGNDSDPKMNDIYDLANKFILRAEELANESEAARELRRGLERRVLAAKSHR